MKKLIPLLLLCLFIAMTTACSQKQNSTAPKQESQAHTHEFGAWKVTKVATCTQSGLRERECSCGKVETEEIPANGHDFKPATCTEPKKCKVCGATEGQPLGHTTTTGVCSRCGEDFTKWDVSYYVDNFNSPTDKWYIYNKQIAVGTFSNSASTNAELQAYILIDENYISLMLYLYGSRPLGNWTTYDNYYDIQIKDSKGKITDLVGCFYYGGDRITILDEYYSTFINILKSSGTVSIYVEYRDSPGTNYLFSVDCTGFSDVYNKYK